MNCYKSCAIRSKFNHLQIAEEALVQNLAWVVTKATYLNVSN